MYQKAIMDIVMFDVEDVITTSVQPPADTTPPAPSGGNVGYVIIL